PGKVEEILPPPLFEAMKERLTARQMLWATGRLDNLGVMKDVVGLCLGGKAEFAAIKDLNTFAIGIAPIDELTMTGYFQLTNAKAAQRFSTLLENATIEGVASRKVEGSPEEQTPWVTWQVRGDIAAMRKMFDKGK